MSHNNNNFRFSRTEEPQAKVEAPVIKEAPAPVVEEAPKATGKIVVTTIDGAVAQDAKGNNHRLYGSKYAAMKVGEIVEF